MTKKLGLYIVFLGILTIILYLGTQAYFSQMGAPVVVQTVTVKDPPSPPLLSTKGLIASPSLTGSKITVPSPEGNQFAVLPKPNGLAILDVQSGRVTAKTLSSGSIKNVTWISERLLFFLTSENSLYTFDVKANRLRLIHTFYVPSSQPFQTIAFSPFTNDMFVIFANDSSNTVSQFDTNEHYYVRTLGNIAVLHAYYTSTSRVLYLEDVHHTLYQLKNGYLGRLRQHAAILKGAANVLFYAVLNGENQAVSVAQYDGNGASHVVCNLSKPVPVGNLVVDHAGTVFAIDSNGFVDETRHRTYSVPSGYVLKKAGNNVLLVSGSRYRIVVN